MGTQGRSVLFFDSRVDGHHSEYIHHLARFASSRADLGDFHFVLPSAFLDYDPVSVNVIRDQTHCNVHFLSSIELDRIRKGPLWCRSFLEWWVVDRYVQSLDVDHCVLMDLNIFQLALGLVGRTSEIELTGILFFPYPRIEKRSGTVVDRTFCWLNRARKHCQLRWMLRNQNLGTIFLLNDKASVNYLNQFWPERRPFRMLPDPVPSLIGREVDEERPHKSVAQTTEEELEEQTGGANVTDSDGSNDYQNIQMRSSDENDRVIFLMFGALREEKGIREVIEAFRQISSPSAKSATLCLYGQVEASFEDEFSELVSSLRRAQPGLRVQVGNRFLPECELHKALKSADVVLAPYLRTEGSSGVIGHSARYRVPVLGPRSGLVGALIEEYNLGDTVEATDPRAIADAVCGYIDGRRSLSKTEGMRRYVDERTPARFAETIFDSVCGAIC